MTATAQFQAKLAVCPVRPFTGRCFRVVDLQKFLEAPDPSMLFDLGPKISKGGQRFSPPGNHRGLYVSTELITAGSEFASNRRDWKTGNCSKHVVFDMSIQLDAILDLTSVSVRKALNISKSNILAPWEGFAKFNNGAWPPTWSLGHQAFASSRFDGILFPSNRNPNGHCLLVFTERLIAGASHVIIHKDDGSEWERIPPTL